MGLGALWDSLVDCICRPPRDEYIYPDELVGGRRGVFRVGRYSGTREDTVLVNQRGMRLQCSHFIPRHVRGKDGRLPCVIYCHCNSGSRRDAEEAICILIPQGVSVFTLDFAGSGLSEGQWVTLGAEEVNDVECAVAALRASGRVSTLGVWGRSMGAVTALLYSQRDPTIAGMVLDSPFSRLTDLMLEIVEEQRLPIPRPLAKLALSAMKRSVQKRAGFDIGKVAPIDVVPQSYIPALFGHATGDSFIKIRHSEALHAAYAGDKNLIRFDGDHNSRRPEFFYNSVSIFWHNTLQLESQLEPADPSALSPHPGPPHSAPGPGLAPVRRQLPSHLPPQPHKRTPSSTSSTASARGAPPSSSSAPSFSSALHTGPGSFSQAPHPPGPAPDSTTNGGPSSLSAAAASGDGRLSGPGQQQQQGRGHSVAAEAAAAGPLSRQEGAVAASLHSATRTPWEPGRLLDRELDRELDRSDHERQHFRRMAGGLHSSPDGLAPGAPGGSTHPAPHADPHGSTPQPQPQPHASTNSRPQQQQQQLYETSGTDDLDMLYSDDESSLANLLVQDERSLAFTAGGGGTTGRSNGLPYSRSATPPGLSGSLHEPGGSRAGRGPVATALGLDVGGGVLLPLSQEDEDEQLRAALELSLLEAAAAGRGSTGAAAAGGAANGGGNGPAGGSGSEETTPLLLQQAPSTAGLAAGRPPGRLPPLACLHPKPENAGGHGVGTGGVTPGGAAGGSSSMTAPVTRVGVGAAAAAGAGAGGQWGPAAAPPPAVIVASSGPTPSRSAQWPAGLQQQQQQQEQQHSYMQMPSPSPFSRPARPPSMTTDSPTRPQAAGMDTGTSSRVIGSPAGTAEGQATGVSHVPPAPQLPVSQNATAAAPDDPWVKPASASRAGSAGGANADPGVGGRAGSGDPRVASRAGSAGSGGRLYEQYSEEELLEMAIALSLQEAARTGSSGG